jgi:hypothetical protein
MQTWNSELVVNNNQGYRSSWMQMALGDDSNDDGDLDPHKELNEYLKSKHEEWKEGLMEWWGVSVLAHHHDILLTDRYLCISTILLTTPPSPALHKTISQSKGPLLPRSMHFQVEGSLGHTYAINSRWIHLKHSRSSRVPFGMGSSMSLTKQRLM